MTIVFKVSEPVKRKMAKYYENKKREKTPPYAIFQAEEGGTIITLYESGKVMFQGISADIDANMWKEIEKKLTGNSVEVKYSKEKKKSENEKQKNFYSLSTIGSDEVGTGDFFGPIVVTGAYISKEQVSRMEELGVKDSKKLTDEKILEIGPTLIKEVNHCTFVLNNLSYNEYQKKGYNMNKIKAILHNKVLVEMKKRQPTYDKIVVYEFVYPRKYFEHILEAKEKVTDITFVTKAESICASVAAASCISRYIFLKKMAEISDEIHVPLLKGAGTLVDKQASDIVKSYGMDKLKEIAKLNFKNAEKLKEYL